MQTIISGGIRPAPGDLVFATVQQIGKQRRIEKPSGRRAYLLPGDHIVVCYGSRYAPDQYEAIISEDLGPCDLVAAGGIASREVSRHDRMHPPTTIMPIGLIGNDNARILNVADYRIAFQSSGNPIIVILVAGTAMNSGKTYTAASLVRSLKAEGYRVAGIKATGTGSGGDVWRMKDMGADVVVDFTDGGFASTYREADEAIERTSIALIDHAARRKCDFAVVEIADGLKHKETATLLQSPTLRARAAGLVFAAYDSMGAKAGYDTIKALGYKILAISGQLTRSPLSMREVASDVDCPILTPVAIQEGALMRSMHHLRATNGSRAPGALAKVANASAEFRVNIASPNRPERIDGGTCDAYVYLDRKEDDDGAEDDDDLHYQVFGDPGIHARSRE
jgi:molybdopterin-guanine dinucleotide biosynthesis protein MobB